MSADVMRHLAALRGKWGFFAEPYEIYLAVIGLISGPAVAFGVTRPSALAVQLSPWMLRAWGGGLIIGGLLTLLGRWLLVCAGDDHRKEGAARVETMGQTILAGAAAMYALAIAAIGAPGIAAAGFVGGYSAACATRARIITNEWSGHRAARRPCRRRRARGG